MKPLKVCQRSFLNLWTFHPSGRTPGIMVWILLIFVEVIENLFKELRFIPCWMARPCLPLRMFSLMDIQSWSKHLFQCFLRFGKQCFLNLYQPVPDDPGYRLYCPPVTPPELTGEYSLYILYAHMEAKPNFKPGDPIISGQLLGTVGNSGYSSNPHLHLELRIGPSGANFTTMAHYQNTVTEEQMSNYCLWRMSGYYQLFDPFILFSVSP